MLLVFFFPNPGQEREARRADGGQWKCPEGQSPWERVVQSVENHESQTAPRFHILRREPLRIYC